MVREIETSTGKYKLFKELGTGAFGSVCLAHHIDTNRKVAFKALEFKEEDEKNILRFKREFEILASLRHPHLSRVIDFGQTNEDKQYFFTTEFCAGQHIFDAVENKPFEYIEEAFVQILSALDYIHSNGVIHFDIKNQNILISERNGHPYTKLIDFGVSARLKSLPKEYAGTLSYMAPEILNRSKFIDHRVDLYSLGILYLKALTGHWPFPNDTQLAIQWHQKGKIPESIWEKKDIPKYTKEIIYKLLAKKPSDRFSNARVVINFLNIATGKKYQDVEKKLQNIIPSEGPIVGREESFQYFKEQFEDTFLKKEKKLEGNVHFISGEQGIGKSRLIEELTYFIELQDIPVMKIQCTHEEPAWKKLKDIIKAKDSKSFDITHDTMSFGAKDSNENVIISQNIESFIQFYKKNPFCLIIDNYENIDPSFERFFKKLTQRLELENKKGRKPKVFIIVSSNAEVNEGIELKRLGPRDISNYIKLVLGEHKNLKKLGKLLHDYSGGLPLLMVEGLKYLAPKMDSWEQDNNILPPPRIDQLYVNKINGLKNEAKKALYVLSLIFRPCHRSELCEIFQVNEENLEALLFEPKRQGLITIDEEGTIQLSSQALSLAIAGNLDDLQKEIIHKVIATGLIHCKSPNAQEIAQHFQKAKNRKEAQEWFEKAAYQLMKEGQIFSASRCMVESMDNLNEENKRYPKLAIMTARFLVFTGDFKLAEKTLERISHIRSTESEEIRGWLAYKLRDFEKARQHYQRAIKVLEKNKYFSLTYLNNALGNVELHAGNAHKAEGIFHHSLVLEKELKSHELCKLTNNNLGLALSQQGRHQEAIKFYRTRIQVLKPDQIPEKIALYGYLGYTYVNASQWSDAILVLTKGLELAEKSGTWQSLFSLLGNLLTAHLKKSNYPESLELLNKMISYQERMGTPRDLAFNYLRQGSVYSILGMEEAAKNCFDLGYSITKDINDKNLSDWFSLMLGFWEKDFGSLDQAYEDLRSLEKQKEVLKDPYLRSWTYFGLSSLFVEKGEIRRSEHYLEKIVKPPRDEEFNTRLELLKIKLKVCKKEFNHLEILLRTIEGYCIKHDFQEVLWEIYLLWGQYRLQGKNNQDACEYFKKCIDTIHNMALSLPEEYRDRYIAQRFKKNLYQYLPEKKKESSPTLDEFSKHINSSMKNPEQLEEILNRTLSDISKEEELDHFRQELYMDHQSSDDNADHHVTKVFKN